MYIYLVFCGKGVMDYSEPVNTFRWSNQPTIPSTPVYPKDSDISLFFPYMVVGSKKLSRPVQSVGLNSTSNKET